jgi:hypothetical protein
MFFACPSVDEIQNVEIGYQVNAPNQNAYLWLKITDSMALKHYIEYNHVPAEHFRALLMDLYQLALASSLRA